VIVVAPRTGLPKGYQQMTLRIESLKERTEPNDGLRIQIARSSTDIVESQTEAADFTSRA
jgi:hypothetical protein